MVNFLLRKLSPVNLVFTVESTVHAVVNTEVGDI